MSKSILAILLGVGPLRSGSKQCSGFSLVESLVLVVILGIMASIAVPSFQFVLRRERVNAIALELAGWLEQVRSAASEQIADDDDEGGCAITISGPTSSATAGYVLAAAASCDRWTPTASIPSELTGTYAVAHTVPKDLTVDPPEDETCTVLLPCVGAVTMNFSPRGMWSFEADADADQDIEIRIASADGRGPKRCVRMSSILGSIEIGSASNGNVNTECNSWGAI